MDLYSDREDEAVQQPTTVKTRICMISDSHGKIPSPDQFKTRPFRYPLPSADILIHAGDLTQYGTYAEHKATVNMLRSADAELKIVIAGNHDITLDRPWWRKHGETVSARYGLGMQDLDRIRDLYCGKEAVENGIRYLEEGVSTFTLKKKKGGATFTVYSSPWQPVHSNWAFTYPLDVDRWNAAPSTSEGGRARFEPPNPVPSHPAIDIMVTHGPPHGVLDITIRPTSTEDDHVGCRHLLRAVARCRPRLHVFGHIHEGRGAGRTNWSKPETTTSMPTNSRKAASRGHEYLDVSSTSREPLEFGKDTLFVNACVVDAHYHARNAPWVVDIELPCQEVDERYPKETDEGQVPDEDAVELTKTENENSV